MKTKEQLEQLIKELEQENSHERTTQDIIDRNN